VDIPIIFDLAYWYGYNIASYLRLNPCRLYWSDGTGLEIGPEQPTMINARESNSAPIIVFLNICCILLPVQINSVFTLSLS
jgi:hypothetical protein